MNQEAVKEKLLEAFGDEVIKETVVSAGQMAVSIPADDVLKVGRFLKEDPELGFDILSFVGGVDWYPDSPRFELVYQLYSMKNNTRFRIKTRLGESEEGPAVVESVTSIWPTADWHERETAEMFGITFANHPDPRKLLLPDEWESYPLRKDFPLEGTEEDTPDLPNRA